VFAHRLSGTVKRMMACHTKAIHPEHFVPAAGYVRKTPKPPLTDNIGLNLPVKQPRKKRSDPELNVRFCPCCGTNLAMVNEAVKMGRGQ
jgi:hypothetical protein